MRFYIGVTHSDFTFLEYDVNLLESVTYAARSLLWFVVFCLKAKKVITIAILLRH